LEYVKNAKHKPVLRIKERGVEYGREKETDDDCRETGSHAYAGRLVPGKAGAFRQSSETIVIYMDKKALLFTVALCISSNAERRKLYERE
jgi:hypothetical protein